MHRVRTILHHTYVCCLCCCCYTQEACINCIGIFQFKCLHAHQPTTPSASSCHLNTCLLTAHATLLISQPLLFRNSKGAGMFDMLKLNREFNLPFSKGRQLNKNGAATLLQQLVRTTHFLPLFALTCPSNLACYLHQLNLNAACPPVPPRALKLICAAAACQARRWPCG